MIEILLKITIALVMFGIGLSISLEELRKIFSRPRKLIIGLIAQIIILPLFVFILVSLINLSPEYKVGLVILAACPGGTLSNFISYIIKADTPLSVGLTTTNSLITLVTIPFYTNLALTLFMKNTEQIILPISQIMKEILIITIIPVLIGSVINYIKKDKTKSTENIIKITSIILLGIVFTLKAISSLQNKQFILNINEIILWAILLNVFGFLMGYILANMLKFPNKTAVTFGIEIGLQNTVLALLISDGILKNPVIGEPALIYAGFSFWTTFLFGIIFRKKIKIKDLIKGLNQKDDVK